MRSSRSSPRSSSTGSTTSSSDPSRTSKNIESALAPLEADDELFAKVNFKTLRNTLIGNFLDWCGVSLPCGTGDGGMPVGFLLSAPRDHDERLLAAALALEGIVAE